MKILRLRLQNLNSLVGEWCIDFEHPDYLQNGLFAITGPTGAGKSTILDAICLGLFGQTPRLSHINKSENEIMSRHRAHCLAEVTFAIDGKTYRSTWSQTRARRHRDGKLQESKHELADANSGDIIEDKKTRTLSAIEALTHLNFKRFTRSVLLAQGSFAAFLQADADERSDMLQQITGTEIYEAISKQIHLNKNQAEQALEICQTAANAVVLLDDVQWAQLQQQLHQAEQDNAHSAAELEALRKIDMQQQKWQQCHLQQQALTQKWQALEQAKLDLEPDLQRLQQAEQALSLQAEFTALERLRQRQQDEKQRLQALQDAVPALQHAADVSYQQWQTAQKHWQHLEQDSRHKQQLWQQVDTIDSHLNQDAQRLEQAQKQQNTQAKRLEDLLAQQASCNAQQTALTQQIELGQQTLQAQTHFDNVQKSLPTWQQQWQEMQALETVLESQQQASTLIEQAMHRNRSHQGDLSAFFSSSEQRQHDADLKIQAEQHSLQLLLDGKTIGECELEQQLLQQQQILLLKIDSLESERQHLQDGAACPLCGSLAHPYVQEHDQIPNVSATDARLGQLRVFLKKVGEHQQAIEQWQINHRNLQQQHDIRVPEMQRLQREFSQLENQLIAAYDLQQHTDQQIIEVFKALTHSWTAAGLNATQEWDEAFAQLHKDLAQYQQHSQTLRDTQASLQLIQKDAEHLQAQIHTAEQDWQRVTQEVSDATAQYRQLSQQRHDLFGEQQTAQAKLAWQQTLQAAQSEHETQHQQSQQASLQYQQAQQRAKDAEQQLQSLQQELNASLYQWQHHLQQQQFADEAHWQAQCLPIAQIEALRAAQTQWQHQCIQLQQALHDNQAALAQLDIQTLDDMQRQQTLAQLQSLQDAYQQQNQHIGALKQQHQQQLQAQQQYAEHSEHLLSAQKLSQQWRQLHKLIGSSDGKKYRLFAQSLTFNHLVQQANLQLQNMSERYLLKQHPEQLLHLDVIDQFQGNEIRSSKNLSGGESFIVSLALALGLARLSSQSTRIESLFLDEGFGTLDEEALDVALNALASLQHEGKIIGVISHVSALKERISTQIQVEPKRNGTSVLRGSGISTLG